MPSTAIISSLFYTDIKGKDVKFITVPAYEGLALNDIAGFCSKFPPIFAYIPDGHEVQKVSKQWLVNVIHSILTA